MLQSLRENTQKLKTMQGELYELLIEMKFKLKINDIAGDDIDIINDTIQKTINLSNDRLNVLEKKYTNSKE